MSGVDSTILHHTKSDSFSFYDHRPSPLEDGSLLARSGTVQLPRMRVLGAEYPLDLQLRLILCGTAKWRCVPIACLTRRGKRGISIRSPRRRARVVYQARLVRASWRS